VPPLFFLKQRGGPPPPRSPGKRRATKKAEAKADTGRFSAAIRSWREATLGRPETRSEGRSAGRPRLVLGRPGGLTAAAVFWAGCRQTARVMDEHERSFKEKVKDVLYNDERRQAVVPKALPSDSFFGVSVGAKGLPPTNLAGHGRGTGASRRASGGVYRSGLKGLAFSGGTKFGGSPCGSRGLTREDQAKNPDCCSRALRTGGASGKRPRRLDPRQRGRRKNALSGRVRLLAVSAGGRYKRRAARPAGNLGGAPRGALPNVARIRPPKKCRGDDPTASKLVYEHVQKLWWASIGPRAGSGGDRDQFRCSIRADVARKHTSRRDLLMRRRVAPYGAPGYGVLAPR